VTVLHDQQHHGHHRLYPLLWVGYHNLTGWPNAPTSNYFNGTLDEVAAYTTTNHWAAG
jgi:hypothetical protein